MKITHAEHKALLILKDHFKFEKESGKKQLDDLVGISKKYGNKVVQKFIIECQDLDMIIPIDAMQQAIKDNRQEFRNAGQIIQDSKKNFLESDYSDNTPLMDYSDNDIHAARIGLKIVQLQNEIDQAQLPYFTWKVDEDERRRRLHQAKQDKDEKLAHEILSTMVAAPSVDNCGKEYDKVRFYWQILLHWYDGGNVLLYKLAEQE